MVGVKNSRVILKRLRDVFELVTETFVSAFCEHVSVEESACKETDDHISALLSDLSSDTGLFYLCVSRGSGSLLVPTFNTNTPLLLFFCFSYILLQFFLKSVFISSSMVHSPSCHVTVIVSVCAKCNKITLFYCNKQIKPATVETHAKTQDSSDLKDVFIFI